MLRFAVFLIALCGAISATEYAPFSSPYTDRSPLLHIFARSDKCATSCESMGSNMCCGKKANCALDGAGNVACCPHNAVCTGTVAAGTQPTGAPSAPGAASAPAPGSGISHAISGTSTISNQYYPFPVIATIYADAADCSTSFSSCQAESAKCTGFVEGGGYGVTVSGQGGQITQQAAMPASSAESICSSLSQEACHGLQVSQCSTLGGAKPTSSGNTFSTGDQSNGGALPARRKAMYGIIIGVAVGLAGRILG